MATKPVYAVCGDELSDFGGILLSPPDEKGDILKDHICKSCYAKVKVNEHKHDYEKSEEDSNDG